MLIIKSCDLNSNPASLDAPLILRITLQVWQSRPSAHWTDEEAEVQRRISPPKVTLDLTGEQRPEICTLGSCHHYTAEPWF